MTTILGRIIVRPVGHRWWRIEHRATGECLHMAGEVTEVLSVAARMHVDLREGRTFDSAFWRALA